MMEQMFVFEVIDIFLSFKNEMKMIEIIFSKNRKRHGDIWDEFETMKICLYASLAG